MGGLTYKQLEDREIDRQMEGLEDRYMDRRKRRKIVEVHTQSIVEGQIGKQMDKWIIVETDRQTDRWEDRLTDGKTDRQMGGQTCRKFKD